MDVPTASTVTSVAGDALAGLPRTLRHAARRGLLAAVAIGVFGGALACAAGMASAGGHDSHSAPEVLQTDQLEQSHVGHSRHAVDGEPAPSTVPDDEGGSAAAGHGHPGMACVTSVQLRVPALVAPGDVRLAAGLPAVAPPDCVYEPEPPVPRSS